MRIVSLRPSATEIVCELGLVDQLVGVTHECDYPPQVRNLPKVTRTLIPHDASSRDIDALVRERLKTRQALYSLDLPDVRTASAGTDCHAGALRCLCGRRRGSGGRGLPFAGVHPKVVNLEPTRLVEVFECLSSLGPRVLAGRQRLLQPARTAAGGRSRNPCPHPPSAGPPADSGATRGPASDGQGLVPGLRNAVGIIEILLSLWLPAVQKAREAFVRRKRPALPHTRTPHRGTRSIPPSKLVE
jgi:hypothetical protein